MTSSSQEAQGLSNEVLLVSVPFPANEQWIANLKASHPGLEIRWVVRPLSAGAEPLSEEMYDNVSLLFTLWPHPAELLPKLRFVQLISAGADTWLDHDLYKKSEITFCTANGAHSPQIAEWVIGTWLMANHHFLAYGDMQKEKRFSPTPLFAHDSPGLRMGVLGYGAIGRQVAKIAYEKPTAESRKDDSYCVPGTGDPDGLVPAKWFHGSSKEELNEFLAQDLDILVLSLPLTGATTRILGREQFDILSKKRTFVSNISRGKHIDTDALLDALREGKIRGAALDVTDPEPLPDGHPLFSAPNVFVTPHISWQTPHLFPRVVNILEKNLENLATGKPLINVVNRRYNY
ncbi:uncharacterized protein P884DRAFT_283489 [Thermothelomyces heterothallicus CBS 202.75]|uniref:uncharacterized protein n=1 Tax=Thermothelomyces heterothallicus CBS 202.75 TaxID=1149848 RepID=UPI0037421AC7